MSSMRADPLNFFTALSEKNEMYTWFRMPGRNILFLCDAEGIKHVLQTNYKNYWKGQYNQVLKPIFGDGIFLAEGDEWKKQRKLSAPSFAGGHFPIMTEDMIASANLMFSRIDKNLEENSQIDIYLELMWFTLDVVLRALFDTKKENIAFDVKDNLAVLLEEAEARIWSMLPLPQKLVLKLPKYKNARDKIVNIVDDIIDISVKRGQKDDLLTVFKNHYLKIKERDLLVDQVMSFLLAGHETTANALAWSFFELGQRPEIQQSLLAEIEDQIGDQALTFDNVKNLKLTKSYFNEILRLYPPVWSMSRESLEEDTIPLSHGEITIPKNTTVMMCTYAMHHSSKYWDHPEALMPERFMGSANEHGYAFFPFGGGARVCLGHKFAEVESVIMITMFLQRYKFSLAPAQNIKPVPAISLKPSHEVILNVERKKGVTSQVVPIDFQQEHTRCPMHAA